MTYNDEIKKASSKKRYLIRIEGVRSLSDGNYLWDESGYYLYNVFIKDCEIKSVTSYNSSLVPTVFTKAESDVFPVDPLNLANGNNSYYFNRSTGELRYYSSNFQAITVVEFYVFFSEDEYIRAPSNITSGEDVTWHPRLIGNPSFGFSQENIVSGFLSISTSSIEIKNQDRWFNRLLSPSFGYNNRSVKIWEYVNDISNSKVSFTGTIKLIDNNNNTCKFSFNDALDLLDIDIYGETATARTLGSLGYDMLESREGLPLRYLYGKVSPYKMKKQDIGLQVSLNVVDKDGLLEAQCSEYNTTKSTSTNRKWHCLMGPNEVANKVFNINNASLYIFVGDMELQVISLDLPVGKSAPDYFVAGDTVQLGAYYGQIQEVFNQSFTIFPKNTSITSGVNCTRIKVPVVVIPDNGVDFYCRAGRDYTCLIGSEGDLQIQFVNNFEATVGISTLDPDTHQVYFRCWYDDFNDRASEQIKRIIDKTSIDTSASFFESSGWAQNFNPEICFTVPFVGSNEYQTAREIIQIMLTSSFIFLYFDVNGELKAKSFLSFLEDPTTVNNESGFNQYESINENNSDNYQVSYDFYDTYKSVRSVNQNHQSILDGREYTNSNTAGYSIMNLTNRIFEHQNILSSRSQSIQAVLYAKISELVCTRKALHSLKGHSTHFSMYLGDDVMIDRPLIIGELNSALMRLMSISKSQNEASLKFIELRAIPI